MSDEIPISASAFDKKCVRISNVNIIPRNASPEPAITAAQLSSESWTAFGRVFAFRLLTHRGYVGLVSVGLVLYISSGGQA